MSIIRADSIKNRAGDGAPDFPNGITVTGIVTATTLNNVANNIDVDDFISVGNNIHLGNAGVCTATSFSGSGANLTSIPAGNLTGALPAISGANLTGISQKVKQIKYLVFNTLVSTGSGTYSDTGIQIQMTPTSASNKLIFSGQIAIGVEKDVSCNFQVYLDSGSGFAVTEEARGPDRNNRTRATTGQGYFLDINDEEYMIKMVPLHVVLDCDNTNQHSVKLYWNQPDVNNRTVYINRTHNDNNEAWIPSYTSHFTLMEVEMS